MAIGRISGPLLKANLVRDGIDLAFENDLLYLDVNNARIGINNSSPATDLDVIGTARATTTVVDNEVQVGNLTVFGNTIQSDLNTISFQPSGDDPAVYNAKLQVDDFQIQGNKISTFVSNSNIEIEPNGTGTIEFIGNTNITGNLGVTGSVTATGNITILGDITIGDETTDTIEFNASIQSDIIPEEDNTYSIGSPTARWSTIHTNDLFADFLNLPELDIGNLEFRDTSITTTVNDSIYIDGNGVGGVRLANFEIVGNKITNVSNNAITQIAQTGTGYFKIGTTNGFVPPRGGNETRPTAYAVVGMTRYNTDSNALEVWDGNAWASPAGASGAVSEIQANDIAATFALTLG